MNATEDDQPLGENPLDSFQRDAVLGVMRAADAIAEVGQRADKQARAINLVRDIHRRMSVHDYAGRVHTVKCRECRTNYPCATIRALDEAGA